jgi:O-antigen ligase
MIGAKGYDLPRAARALPVAVCVLAAAALAAGCAIAPVMALSAMIAIGIGVPLLRLVWLRPELGLLGLIFLTSSFIPADIVDVRLPVGGLKIRDLALLALLGMLALRGILRGGLVLPWWPVSGPLLALFGAATFSLLYAILYMRVEPNWAFSEFRCLIFYAALFVTAWSIERPRQLVVLLIGLYVLVDLTTTIVIMQQFLGQQNRLLAAMTGGNWRVWSAGATSDAVGTVRVIPPGHVLMYYMMLIAFGLMIYTKQRRQLRALLAAQFVFINIGLLFTYTRAEWIASVLAIGLIVALLPLADKIQFARHGLIILFVLVLGYNLAGDSLQAAFSNSQFADAFITRLTSIFTPDQTLGSDSLEWRGFENERAIESIQQHPLFGVGLGNAYRDTTLFQRVGLDNGLGGAPRFTRYIHSSYFYLVVKLGIPSFLIFCWFCLALIWHNWQAYRSMTDPQCRRMTLAILASFVGLLTWAISHSHLILDESTVVVGLSAGMVASMIAIDQAQAPAGIEWSR